MTAQLCVVTMVPIRIHRITLKVSSYSIDPGIILILSTIIQAKKQSVHSIQVDFKQSSVYIYSNNVVDNNF